MENISFEDIIKEKLLHSKNIILTGAPGTGKTYLAKEIAKKMDAETEFVQFHPSYDYTDFVEGLRPKKEAGVNELGFELKNGVFKNFCKKALKNLIDSSKSEDELKQQQSISESLSSFIEEIDNEISDKGLFELEGIGGKPCAPIIEIDSNNFITKSKSDNTLSTPLSSILIKYEKFKKTGNIKWTFKEVGEKLGVTYHHTYFFAFLKAFDNYLKNHAATIEKVDKVKKKDFVFIIDEINRGEISKIFGELFFSIDPGYRGISGKVKTQYSNIQTEETKFTEDIDTVDFYVPENVYIIGTMNDIDRSVETFDFAMRRRFTWIEIKATDRTDMLNETLGELKEQAVEKMNAINSVIENIEELNPSYHIGPAYFLKLKTYNGSFEDLWKYNLEPLIKEYLRGLPSAVSALEKLKNAYFSNGEQIS